MDRIRIHTVFIAVFDKQVLEKLVPVLLEYKIKALGTAGTVAYLQSRGVQAENVVEGYEYDGRVKSLSRKNFVAILADKNKSDHVLHLKEEGIDPIDAVIVDLYKPDPKNFPETMDIGGQALIRAAIKNYANVAVAFDRASINKLAEQLVKHNGETPLSYRKNAAKAAAEYIAQRAKLEADYFADL
jgi:phosphoribosylaminoimidazolecarboxamide formyltransferase/IMP cyclohydrolase